MNIPYFFYIPDSEKKTENTYILSVVEVNHHPPPFSHFNQKPGIQLCVTKPVLLESECSMRQGHMGFLPTSSLPFSPSLEYTQMQPAKQHK